MNTHVSVVSQSFERWGHWGVALVLGLAFITGGGASDRGPGDALVQWLALWLLAWALLALWAPGVKNGHQWTLWTVLLLVGVVAVQQLPLPMWAWQWLDTRAALADDLRKAGLERPLPFWSLTPFASERGLWSLLPAIAVFVGALMLSRKWRRRMLLIVVGLSAASLLLGYLQMGAPRDSLLNPFPEWPPAMNGVFANPNHQATALAISLVVCTALLIEGWRRRRREGLSPLSGELLVLAALMLPMLVSLPLTGSRAALLLAILGVSAAFLLLWKESHKTRPPFRVWGMRLGLGVLVLGAVVSAVGWLRHDMAEEVRLSLAAATLSMGNELAPWGSGTGSFVPWFEQHAPMMFVQREYFNHAHNEYAQWWLESGVMAVFALAASLLVLFKCFPRRWQNSEAGTAVAIAAWVGCLLLLAHSMVDYPLRTPALMTVAGLLAGLVVAHRTAVKPMPAGNTESGSMPP